MNAISMALDEPSVARKSIRREPSPDLLKTVKSRSIKEKFENLDPAQYNGAGNAWNRFKNTFSSVEVMQPAILSLSVAYIVYSITTKLEFTEEIKSVTNFSNYCCIIGFILTCIYYSKLFFNDAIQRSLSILHVLLLVFLVCLYIGHWFKNTSDCLILTPHPMNLVVYCSNPLHLVLQSAYMFCVIYCIILYVCCLEPI